MHFFFFIFIEYFVEFIILYRPDTATYIQKMEREREAREKGKSNNNKSMLGKYVSLSFSSII